ncbi:extracellular solute-binding protein [Clostridium sp.]
MKGKKISILLCLVMAISISASGCGSKTTAVAKKSSDLTNMNVTGAPIVKDKVTYTIDAKKKSVVKDFSTLKFFTQMEEKTNVKINWNVVPEEAWEEKKSLIFAGNDLPDAFYGPWVLNDNDIWKYASQGFLIPLDDMIDKYCPNLKKLFATNPDYKKALVTPDGKIYSLPQIDQMQTPIVTGMFINKKWLDTLGLKIPTTTDELKTVLEAFKEKDPNGNGKKDEVPLDFVFKNDGQGIYSLFGSFGLVDYVPHIIVKDNKVLYTEAQPEFKEGIKYLNSLAKEDLIDKEAFTQNVAVYSSKVKSKNVGMFFGWSISTFFADGGEDYVALPPLKGPNGDQMWTNKESYGLQSKGAFAITSKCENPEILMRWIDESYDPDKSVEAALGLFGTALTKRADGKAERLPAPKGMTAAEFRHQDVPGVSGVFGISQDYAANFVQNKQYTEKTEIVKMYQKYVTKNIMQMPSLFYSEADTEKITSVTADVLAYSDSQFAKWVLDGGIDGEWDNYLKKFNDMGLEDMMKIYQTAYDKSLK